MSDARWAPVFYGRTEEVDFRFLALPEDAGHVFRQSALDALRPIMRNIQALRGRPAWCVFTAGTTRVFGAVAYVADLITSPDEQFMTRVGTRDLYGFAGYAAKQGVAVSLPKFDDLDRTLVHPLLAFVRRHWDDRSHRMQPDLTAYDVPIAGLDDEAVDARPFDRTRIELVPSAEGRTLWIRATVAVRSGRDAAVAVKLPTADGFAASAFDAVSTDDVREPTFVRRDEARKTPRESPCEESRSSAPQPTTAARAPRPESRGVRAPNAVAIGENFAIAVVGGTVIVLLCAYKHWIVATLALGGGAWAWSRLQPLRRKPSKPKPTAVNRTTTSTMRGFRAAASDRPARDDAPWD